MIQHTIVKGPICVRCKRYFTKKEIAKGEYTKVKTGPGKGKPMIILFCPDCSQRNIVVKNR